MKILIIDDDPIIRLLLQITLARQGYHITVASNGEEGLRSAKEIHPAMVICDWMMPKMNGLEVCSQVKAIPELSTTFFILLTSMDSVQDRVKGLDAGADDFLCKPIEMFELEARVRAGLRLHQLSRDLEQQKQLLEAELASAAEYVSFILPEPLTDPPTTIDVRFIPSRQLGGDGFDYYWLDSENLAVYLLDVSGHGLRAALPSISTINLLRFRSLTQVNYYQPSEVLRGLNETFQMNQRHDKYFTMWYGVYNRRKQELTYANAGHPPAILLGRDQGGSIRERRLKTPVFPVGMFPDAEYRDVICPINSPSHLYIFSDGIYEITQTDDRIWGLDQFVELLGEYYDKQQSNLDLLLQQVLECNPQDYFNDDLSIVEIDFQ